MLSWVSVRRGHELSPRLPAATFVQVVTFLVLRGNRFGSRNRAKHAWNLFDVVSILPNSSMFDAIADRVKCAQKSGRVSVRRMRGKVSGSGGKVGRLVLVSLCLNKYNVSRCISRIAATAGVPAC